MLKSLFETSDLEGKGFVTINQLPELLVKLGKNEGKFFIELKKNIIYIHAFLMQH